MATGGQKNGKTVASGSLAERAVNVGSAKECLSSDTC